MLGCALGGLEGIWEKDAATIMKKVSGANGLFEPLNHSSFDLEDVVPSFGACFTLQELNRFWWIGAVGRVETSLVEEVYILVSNEFNFWIDAFLPLLIFHCGGLALGN